MPTFDTPAPISAVIEFEVGDLRIVAGDRPDTKVDVRPTNPAKASDVTAAEQTRVEYANGNLLVKGPKGRKYLGFRGDNESIDITIELPSGSRVQAEAGVVAIRAQGVLGECRVKTGVGDVRLEQVGALQVKSGAGDITVDRAAGQADVTTGSGAVRVGVIDGSAVVKDSNGNIWLGEVGGDLRVTATNGEISVDRAHSTVVAKNANGDVRLGQVETGAVSAHTARGSLEIGVRTGVAAWLDLNTQFGTVHNNLVASDAPPPGDASVEVRARTAFGDVTIYRTGAAGPSNGRPGGPA